VNDCKPLGEGLVVRNDSAWKDKLSSSVTTAAGAGDDGGGAVACHDSAFKDSHVVYVCHLDSPDKEEWQQLAPSPASSPLRHRQKHGEQGEQGEQGGERQAAPAGQGDGRMHRSESAFFEVRRFRLTLPRG
jgi:hypothetical protein